eukprot:TRINITY_DN18695_c0_g1_i1.p1 TRINITY_DN18695_c0_g1~~TRINITY_DN18695_c0_g1_i1.p1  ORF type:complete len:353 (+),score=44.61 TRINITY_DN18695_c0_g1_i1:66-1061(+)
MYTKLTVVSRRLFTSIPLIDVTPYVKHSNVEKVVPEIMSACQDAGFFQVTGLTVTKEVKQKAFSELRNFFDAPRDEKMKIHVSKNLGVRGFIAEYEQGNYGVDTTDKRAPSAVEEEQMDYKQVFTLGTELAKSEPCYNDSMFAENVWPDATTFPAFRPAIEAYYSEVLRSSQIMFELFALCLGLKKDFFKPITAKPMNSMNCILYPPEANSTGIGSHTDFECFTLLAQGDVPGLEVYSDDGNWVPVPANPDALVVNIGDMLARWSNNKMKSTVHRALNHRSLTRQSIAFFCCCDYDATIIPVTVGDEVPLFEPVQAGDHLMARINQANLST